MEYRYDIRGFFWNKESNTFFAEAWNLECILPDGMPHPEAFPNGKQQFFIDNPKTGGFRRFRYVGSETETHQQWNYMGELQNYTETYWVYETEDGIKCNITINVS